LTKEAVETYQWAIDQAQQQGENWYMVIMVLYFPQRREKTFLLPGTLIVGSGH